MRIFRPKAQRDLEKAGRGLLDASGLDETGRADAQQDGDTLVLSLVGSTVHRLAEKAQRLNGILNASGIETTSVSSLEQLRAESDARESQGDIRAMVGAKVAVPISANGGVASLQGKLRDTTVELQIQAARGGSFRDRLAAEPKLAGQAR